MKSSILILPAFLLVLPVLLIGADSFEHLKRHYSESEMVKIEFDLLIESKVFKETDSLAGIISIARDGRYCARINGDIFWFDGQFVWEYSAENNQASKKSVDDNQQPVTELVFLKNLDEFYRTTTLIHDSLYRLNRSSEDENSLPDSILVRLQDSVLFSLEYYDLNGDLNQAIIKEENFLDSVNEAIFDVELPDSTEIITLP